MACAVDESRAHAGIVVRSGVRAYFWVYARKKRGKGLQRDHDTSFVILVFELLEVLLGPRVLGVSVFIIYDSAGRSTGLWLYTTISLTDLDSKKRSAFCDLVVHSLIDNARDIRPVCGRPVCVVRPYCTCYLASNPMREASRRSFAIHLDRI